jgi:galactose mutarotase-like enzyme
MQTLKNDVIEITVSERGAELQSIKTLADNHDYLFNGDPKYWDFRSPLLFPVEGKLRDGKYRYEGQEFELPNHGFARTSAFELSKSGKDYVSYTLSSSEETLKHYPFEFILKVGYRIDGNRVFVLWTVTNLDDREMLFSIGAHPAFRAPMDDGGTFDDCYLEFDEFENTPCYHVSDKGLLLPEPHDCLHGHTHDLHYSEFSGDVLIFKELKSGVVTLRSRKSDHFVSVSAPDFPLWGFWTPKQGGAPFICIEPWFGHPDPVNADGELKHKPALVRLSPSQTYSQGYVISVG